MDIIEENSNELFKQAGEHYPLKINEGNWDKVASRLNQPKDRGIPIWWYAAALMLLAVPSVLWMYNDSVNTNFHNPIKKSQVASEIKKNSSHSLIKTETQSTLETKEFFKKENFLIDNSKKLTYLNVGQTSKRVKTGIENLQKPTIQEKSELVSSPALDKNLQSNSLDDNTQKQNELIVSQPIEEAKKDDLNESVNKNETVNSTITLKNISHRFYFGMLSSPVFTSVKSQEYKSGTSFGIFAGIRINKNLFMELGLRKETRSILTQGENFSDIYLKQKNSTSLVFVDGKANILNIPFNLRYSFSSKNKNNFFTTIGTNAILIHREDYNFDLLRNGTLDNVDRVFYKRPPNKVFSELILSGGYERSLLNDKLRLRAEPWFSRSLSGLGTGQVKASNVGINVGISIGFK